MKVISAGLMLQTSDPYYTVKSSFKCFVQDIFQQGQNLLDEGPSIDLVLLSPERA